MDWAVNGLVRYGVSGHAKEGFRAYMHKLNILLGDMMTNRLISERALVAPDELDEYRSTSNDWPRG
jgi:hypothetical protein